MSQENTGRTQELSGFKRTLPDTYLGMHIHVHIALDAVGPFLYIVTWWLCSVQNVWRSGRHRLCASSSDGQWAPSILAVCCFLHETLWPVMHMVVHEVQGFWSWKWKPRKKIKTISGHAKNSVLKNSCARWSMLGGVVLKDSELCWHLFSCSTN